MDYIFKVYDRPCLQTVQSQVEGYINVNFFQQDVLLYDNPKHIINILTVISKFRIFQNKNVMVVN